VVSQVNVRCDVHCAGIRISDTAACRRMHVLLIYLAPISCDS